MEPIIRQVSASEVPPLHQILVACGLDMKERFGLGYWVPPYPLEKMVKDLDDKSVYALFVGEEVVGTFTLETTIPPEYTKYGNIRWQAADVPAIYVQGLNLKT